MVVRIRLGRGAVVSRRAGKNSRIARVTATVLSLVSISLGSFGLWRVGADLGWAGDFVFTTGILSHWQVWIGAAIAVQYLVWQLSQYARRASAPAPKAKAPEEPRPRVAVTSHV